MAEFRKGDKVRVKSDIMSTAKVKFVGSMNVFKGTIQIVSKVLESGAIALENGYSYDFDAEWLELIQPKSILTEAETIINGERDVDYGDPTESFEKIAQIASLLTNKDLDADTCCAVMMAVKLTRQSFKHKRDNLVDLCGYAEIMNQIKSK